MALARDNASVAGNLDGVRSLGLVPDVLDLVLGENARQVFRL